MTISYKLWTRRATTVIESPNIVSQPTICHKVWVGGNKPILDWLVLLTLSVNSEKPSLHSLNLYFTTVVGLKVVCKQLLLMRSFRVYFYNTCWYSADHQFKQGDQRLGASPKPRQRKTTRLSFLPIPAIMYVLGFWLDPAWPNPSCWWPLICSAWLKLINKGSGVLLKSPPPHICGRYRPAPRIRWGGL